MIYIYYIIYIYIIYTHLPFQVYEWSDADERSYRLNLAGLKAEQAMEGGVHARVMPSHRVACDGACAAREQAMTSAWSKWLQRREKWMQGASKARRGRGAAQPSGGPLQAVGSWWDSTVTQVT